MSSFSNVIKPMLISPAKTVVTATPILFYDVSRSFVMFAVLPFGWRHRDTLQSMWPSIGERNTLWAWLPSDVSASFDPYVWGILGLGFVWNSGWNMYTRCNLFVKWATEYQKNYEWTKACHKAMSHDDSSDLLSHLPFGNASNIENEFRSAKFRITQLMNNHQLDKFL